MKRTITVFKGDGIGPEITDCVLEILEAAGAELEYEVYNVGETDHEKEQSADYKRWIGKSSDHPVRSL